MSDSLRSQIKQTFSERETEDLLDMWQTNDRVEWTDEAFDVLREVLLERLSELPMQNEPVYKHLPEQTDPNPDDLPDDEAVFYQPGEVKRLIGWLNQGVLFFLIILFLQGLIGIPDFYRAVGNLTHFFYPNAVLWPIVILALAVSLGITAAIYLFGARALRSILLILMQMEFNSRGAGPTPPEKQIDA